MQINMVIAIYVITVVNNALVLLISNVLTVSLEINKMINNIIMDINMKEDALKITVHCRLIITII